MKPYVIIRAAVENIVSTAFWRTDIEPSALTIIASPEMTTEELADRLIEVALELKGTDT